MPARSADPAVPDRGPGRRHLLKGCTFAQHGPCATARSLHATPCTSCPRRACGCAEQEKNLGEGSRTGVGVIRTPSPGRRATAAIGRNRIGEWHRSISSCRRQVRTCGGGRPIARARSRRTTSSSPERRALRDPASRIGVAGQFVGVGQLQARFQKGVGVKLRSLVTKKTPGSSARIAMTIMGTLGPNVDLISASEFLVYVLLDSYWTKRHLASSQNSAHSQPQKVYGHDSQVLVRPLTLKA